MKKGISFTKIWSDDDLVELSVIVFDGNSSFANTVYIDQDQPSVLVKDLSVFRDQTHSGIKEIRFGEFGPEYANGDFHVRLHFRAPGGLLVFTHQQSEFVDFSVSKVASESKMYLTSEPILLDNFISELKGLANGVRENANLECI